MDRLRCLVVDDNAFTAIVIRQALNSLGVTRVETATDGRDALEKIDSMQPAPDVILLDLRMPVMGGVEMLSRLADRRFEGNVILMSGVDEDTLHSVEKMALESDTKILGSLVKPPSAEDLESMLQLLVAK